MLGVPCPSLAVATGPHTGPGAHCRQQAACFIQVSPGQPGSEQGTESLSHVPTSPFSLTIFPPSPSPACAP